jgi:hypothetical protein
VCPRIDEFSEQNRAQFVCSCFGSVSLLIEQGNIWPNRRTSESGHVFSVSEDAPIQ